MVARWLARLLEHRKPAWLGGFGVSLDPVRELRLPTSALVVGVGGATLGGSGRTPLALALAQALGPHAALVVHGYGGRASRARRARPDDDVADIGDEALLAARAHAQVFVGARAAALRLAADAAPVVVVDRLLQTRPRRVAASVLAVDADAPWGSGARLPFGDLLERPARLGALADEVVAVGGPLAPQRFRLERSVEGAKVGAVASMARPARMARALATLGVAPTRFVERSDHAPFTAAELARLSRVRVDAWIVDAKTDVLLPRGHGLPTVRLTHEVVASTELVERLHGRLVAATLAKRADGC